MEEGTEGSVIWDAKRILKDFYDSGIVACPASEVEPQFRRFHPQCL